MKAFQKLALAAAIASVPMMGMAMEPLNDEGLAGVTGQDGISINVDLNQLNLNMYIEDTDGLTGSGVANEARIGAGMIAITGLELNTDQGINISIDSGSASGAGAASGVLRLGVNIPHLSINPDDAGGAANPFSIGVAGVTAAAIDSNEVRNAADGWTRIDAAKGTITEIISLGNITLENLDLNIELGPEASQFLAINTTSAIDLSLANFELKDVNAGGSLFTDEISVQNIRLDGTTAAITANGLSLELGDGGLGMKVALMGLGFGDAASTAALGNVYIDGLNLGGTTVTVQGH